MEGIFKYNKRLFQKIFDEGLPMISLCDTFCEIKKIEYRLTQNIEYIYIRLN